MKHTRTREEKRWDLYRLGSKPYPDEVLRWKALYDAYYATPAYRERSRWRIIEATAGGVIDAASASSHDLLDHPQLVRHLALLEHALKETK